MKIGDLARPLEGEDMKVGANSFTTSAQGDMKIGDLIRFEAPWLDGEEVGIILGFEHYGDSANVLWQDGEVEEVDADYCEVIG